MIFFLILTVRELSIGRILSEKKYEGAGLISEKTEVLYIELNERAEAATGSYSGTGDSLQLIYSLLVSKNHLNIRSRSLVHEFSFTNIFYRYKSWLQSSYIKEKFFVAASILYGCGYLFLL